MKEHHEQAIRELVQNHRNEIEAVKTEAQAVKELSEERLRIELKVSDLLKIKSKTNATSKRIDSPHNLLSMKITINS